MSNQRYAAMLIDGEMLKDKDGLVMLFSEAARTAAEIAGRVPEYVTWKPVGMSEHDANQYRPATGNRDAS